MPKKNIKEPVENQRTAAWANINSLKENSNVPIPSELDVLEAKEYVEENKK